MSVPLKSTGDWFLLSLAMQERANETGTKSDEKERLIHLLSLQKAEFKPVQGDKKDFLHVCLMSVVVSSEVLQTALP